MAPIWRKASSRVRCGRKNVVLHGGIVQESGAARVHAGGHARRETTLVGMDRAAVAAVIEMPVQVNQPRGDQFARHIHQVSCQVRVDAFGDGGDLAILKRHVALPVDALGRIEERATLLKPSHTKVRRSSFLPLWPVLSD